MQILQGYQDLSGKEFDGLKGEAVAGLSTKEGVEVPTEMELPSEDMLVAAAVGTAVVGSSSGNGGCFLVFNFLLFCLFIYF